MRRHQFATKKNTQENENIKINFRKDQKSCARKRVWGRRTLYVKSKIALDFVIFITKIIFRHADEKNKLSVI
jgi:hypothetical protein